MKNAKIELESYYEQAAYGDWNGWIVKLIDESTNDYDKKQNKLEFDNFVADMKKTKKYEMPCIKRKLNKNEVALVTYYGIGD